MWGQVLIKGFIFIHTMEAFQEQARFLWNFCICLKKTSHTLCLCISPCAPKKTFKLGFFVLKLGKPMLGQFDSLFPIWHNKRQYFLLFRNLIKNSGE